MDRNGESHALIDCFSVSSLENDGTEVPLFEYDFEGKLDDGAMCLKDTTDAGRRLYRVAAELY